MVMVQVFMFNLTAMKNKIIGFVVGFICALMSMLIMYMIETHAMNQTIPEFFQGIVFASALIAGRNATIEFLSENHL